MSAIPLPRGRRWHGLDAHMVASMILCAGILSAAASLRLVPEIEKMNDAYDQLCAGLKEFSYGVGTIGQISWAASSSHTSEAVRDLKNSGRYNLIRSVIARGENFNVHS